MEYSRPLNDIRVGGEIDAMCTRCRRVTNHRIVAMVEGFVKRVMCLTCQSEHNYRQPPGEKGPAAAKTKRVSKELKKAAAPDTGARVFAQWLKSKEGLKGEPTPYSIHGSFEAGQAIAHAKFGLGFVQKAIPPNKIEVMFEKEIKTLAANS